jgi:hypothetical protein
VLLCDTVTAGTPAFAASPLVTEVDAFISCPTPEGGPTFRSRYVKTSMHRWVKGPFLFLDLDILVRGDLSPVFALDCNVAAATNHSTDLPAQSIWHVEEELFATMGWQRDRRHYLNSGVVYFSGSPGAHAVGEAWHAAWSASIARSGKHYDQPAFNAALFQAGARVQVLPHAFNAQVANAPAAARNAVIWHFFASVDTADLFEYNTLVQQVQQRGELDLAGVQRMLKAPHPWRRRSWPDDVVAASLMREGKLRKWHRSWFKGARTRALREWWSDR